MLKDDMDHTSKVITSSISMTTTEFSKLRSSCQLPCNSPPLTCMHTLYRVLLLGAKFSLSLSLSAHIMHSQSQQMEPFLLTTYDIVLGECPRVRNSPIPHHMVHKGKDTFHISPCQQFTMALLSKKLLPIPDMLPRQWSPGHLLWISIAW